MSFVYTANGPGRIVDTDLVRGRKQFFVEGAGFKRWFWEDEVQQDSFSGRTAAADVDMSNSVTLPYDPEPQFPANYDETESTIQPGYEIEPDDRLTPADSLTFEEEEYSEGEAYGEPGPSPDLFAGGGAEHFTGGLDQSKFAPILSREDLESDEAQFRENASAYMSYRMAMLNIGPDERLAEYMDICESVPEVRKAAWRDVQAKGVRLRSSGAIDLRFIDRYQALANVTGDHGEYETMIVRGNVIAGGKQSITEWACSCPWGQHAFERKYTYIGRLCSHAYALYLEMQSQANRKKKSNKEADVLRTKPFHLTPDFIVNDTEDDPEFLYQTDVEEDDRVTTGPDQIIQHFSSEVNEYDPTPVGTVPVNEDNENLDDLRFLIDEGTEDSQGDMEHRNDTVRDVVEDLRDRGFDADNLVANKQAGYPEVQDHEPFEGVGPSSHNGFGTSDDYVNEHEKPHFQDVQDLDNDEPITQYTAAAAPPRKRKFSQEGGGIKRQSQQSSEEFVMGTPPPPMGSAAEMFDEGGFAPGTTNVTTASFDEPEDDDRPISANALKHADIPDFIDDDTSMERKYREAMAADTSSDGDLTGPDWLISKTAGRNFSIAEQESLIMEAHPEGARNLPTDDDLVDTHYLSL